jgi:hypothetical protein
MLDSLVIGCSGEQQLDKNSFVSCMILNVSMAGQRAPCDTLEAGGCKTGGEVATAVRWCGFTSEP